MFIIFDLDMTLIDSSIAESHRRSKNWATVYSLINNFVMYDGIKKSLDFLSCHNIKYVIVTSSPRTYSERVARHFNLTPEFLVCFHDTEYRKPDPAPINKAISGLSTHNNIFSFGDQDTDIIASKRAGITSIGCLWGTNNSEKLIQSNPDFLLKTPEDLYQFIISKYQILCT